MKIILLSISGIDDYSVFMRRYIRTIVIFIAILSVYFTHIKCIAGVECVPSSL